MAAEPQPPAGRRGPALLLPAQRRLHGEFLFWSDDLPGYEIWGAQPPGRGGRMAEEPFTAMSDLVASIADGVEFSGPYALFGHSLGAAVVYEVALLLRERGKPLPDRLYLSAHEAPHLHRRDPSLPLLDDDALLAEVGERYDAVPEELREDPEWLALVLEGLRADLRIVAGYRPTRADPLPCDLVAMGGTADPLVTRDDLAAWRAYTTGAFELRMYQGDHFYFREQQHDVQHHLAADLARPAR